MKKVICLLFAGLMVASANAATSLNWASDSAFTGTLPDVLDSAGDVVPVSSDWYLQLFDMSYATWDAVLNPTGGELYNSTSAFQLANGLAFVTVPEIYPWASGKTLGTRLYNSNNPATATEYAVASGSVVITTLTGSVTTDPTSLDYNIGTIGQGDWVAVPEPATAMFGLVGLVTLAIARRRKQQ